MRLIGDLDDPQRATTFVSYLAVKGIACQVEQEGDKFELWVKDEDRCAEAVEELATFKQDPTNSQYVGAIQQAKSLEREEEKRRRQIQKKIVKVGAGGLDRKPPLTIIMIAICIFVAIFTDFGEADGDHWLFKSLQFVSVSAEEANAAGIQSIDDLKYRLISISKGEIWRIVTPIFIHYGIFHILFNMYMFFQFGKVIENRYGTWKFGLLVLATAAIPMIVQCLVPMELGGSPPYSIGDTRITSVGGMSGVVYGLFGFFWMKSTYDRSFGYRIPQSTVLILLVWLVFCMLPADMRAQIGFGSHVANWAHGIGLAVGVAIGYATSITKQ